MNTQQKFCCFSFSRWTALLVVGVTLFTLGNAKPVQAQLLRDICRVKGQEENTLQGLGLVIGLKGTGDNEIAPTSRALATMMKLMGQPLGQGKNNQDLLEEVKKARNVALVFVTATVPAAGARRGDQITCRIAALHAKSLEGGVLAMTPLLGPKPGSSKVYAFAQGTIHLENLNQPATGVIHHGCRLEENFFNSFSKDGKITLVLREDHAGFQMAQDIAELINTQSYSQGGEGTGYDLAKALDQVNIEVTIPKAYLNDPVLFVAQILSHRNVNPQTEARVVINERTGSIVVTGNVEIGPVAVTHKNMMIEAGAVSDSPSFIPIDPGSKDPTKLKALIDALNSVSATPQDKIDIIKGLQRSGKLYGKLIIE